MNKTREINKILEELIVILKNYDSNLNETISNFLNQYWKSYDENQDFFESSLLYQLNPKWYIIDELADLLEYYEPNRSYYENGLLDDTEAKKIIKKSLAQIIF